jgi:hypothetical protein
MAEEATRNVVSLDDENIVQASVNYFKGQKDQKYRIRIPDISSILMYRQHYVNDVGFMRCLQDRDEECPICKMVDDPITRFKTNILVYNTTTSDGTLPEDLNYVSVMPQVMRFGIKMFSVLRAKHKKFASKGGLGSIDLILTCTNEAYQHFDVEDDSVCASLENPRLKSMAEKIMKEKFIDFNTYRDRDLKFLTPIQQKVYVEKATGVVQAAPKTEAETEDPNLADAEKILNAPESESDGVGQSVKDLI